MFTKNLSVYERIYYHFLLCANICSIHGFAHFVRKGISPAERILWIILIMCAVGLCVPIGSQAWTHYQFRPTVISLEKDFWNWNTTLPSFTLCLQEVDNMKLKELIRKLEIPEKDRQDFQNFVINLATGNIENNFGNDKYMNNALYANGENYLDWILETSLFSNSEVEIVQQLGIVKELEEVITEFGLCFIYNSEIAMYSNPRSWTSKSQDLVFPNPIVVNQSIPSPSIAINNLSSNYTIYFHGTNEIPDLTVNGVVVPFRTFAYLELQIESVWTPSEVKDLKISQRICRYPDESNLEHSPVYSYNLCRMECRIKLCLKLCKCIPYYYRRVGNEHVCNPIEMQCWLKHQESIKFLHDENNNTICSCLQTCDVASVTVKNQDIMNWFIGTSLQWKIPTYPTIRYKRTLIFSFTNLLVQIGGVAGLMLGFSVLSLIEICYFFTLRLYWAVCRGRLFQVD